MNNLEKIISHIEAEGINETQAIMKAANEQAQEIVNAAMEEGKKITSEITMDAIKKEKQIIDSAENSARQLEKQQALKTKQAAIAKVIECAKEKLYNLSDERYLEIVEKMLKTYAHKNESGLIAFNEKDKGRIDEKVYSSYGLSLSENSANIDGGFVLIYGGIEENCSFEAIIDSKKEELSDKIASLLFADGK